MPNQPPPRPTSWDHPYQEAQWNAYVASRGYEHYDFYTGQRYDGRYNSPPVRMEPDDQTIRYPSAIQENAPMSENSFQWTDLIVPGITAYAAYQGQRDANRTNLRESQTNRDFQIEASNTAYRRAMRDLELAGLNPILAARQPASTPAGSSTRIDSALQPAVSSAIDAWRAGQQQQQTNSNVRVANQQIEKMQQEVELIGQQWRLTGAQTRAVSNEANLLIQKLYTEEGYTTKAKSEARLKELEADFYTNNNLMFVAKEIGVDAALAVNVFKSVFKTLRSFTKKPPPPPKPKTTTTTTYGPRGGLSSTQIRIQD